jgi:uncharacterized phage-like protein YoqJ
MNPFVTKEKWKPFKYKDHKELRKEQDKDQDKTVIRRWKDFVISAGENAIEFHDLNQKGRKSFFPKMNKLMDNGIQRN